MEIDCNRAITVKDNDYIMFTSIQEEISQVRELIWNLINSEEKLVRGPLQQTFINEGKLLRPALMLWAARSGNCSDKANLIKAAAAIELLHVATLVHDDIIDEGDLRRGVPSVRAAYGNQVAVYAGDSLLMKSIKLLHENVEGEIIGDFIKSIDSVFKGEILQYQNRCNEITLDEYLQIVSGKTGSLFALAMGVGASFGGFDTRIKDEFYRLGMEFGIVFQMADDCIDYSKTMEKAGKNVQNDLKQGIYTMPILMALKNDDGHLRNLLKKLFLEGTALKEIRKEVALMGGIQLANEEIRNRINGCREILSSLPIESKHENDMFTGLLNEMECQING